MKRQDSKIITTGMKVIYNIMEANGFKPFLSEISYQIIDKNHRSYHPMSKYSEGQLRSIIPLAIDELQANFPNSDHFRHIEFSVFDVRVECFGALLVELDKKYSPIKMSYLVRNTGKIQDDTFHVEGQIL